MQETNTSLALPDHATKNQKKVIYIVPTTHTTDNIPSKPNANKEDLLTHLLNKLGENAELTIKIKHQKIKTKPTTHKPKKSPNPTPENNYHTQPTLSINTLSLAVICCVILLVVMVAKL